MPIVLDIFNQKRVQCADRTIQNKFRLNHCMSNQPIKPMENLHVPQILVTEKFEMHFPG